MDKHFDIFKRLSQCTYCPFLNKYLKIGIVILVLPINIGRIIKESAENYFLHNKIVAEL